MKRFKTVATLLCALTLAVGAVAFSACGSGDEGVIKGNYKEATALEMINAVKAVDEDKLFTPEEGKDALGYELKASAKLGASYGGGTLGEQFELNANAKAEFKLALKQNEANGISASSAGSVSFKLKSSLKQLNSLNADAELYTDDSNVYVGASIKTVADGAEDSSSFKYKIPFTTIGDIIGGIGGMNGFAEEDIYGELGLEGIVSIAVMAGFKSYIDTSDGLKIKLTADGETLMTLLAGSDTATAARLALGENCRLEIYLAIDANGKFAGFATNSDMSATVTLAEGESIAVNVKNALSLKAFAGEIKYPANLDEYLPLPDFDGDSPITPTAA
ncbi:MAG: hypothetical protein HFK03_01960 [Clostridia bacterium]|jgi:hypothetical protein|nr:hypothetical protein [Clostridia bacterium]